MASEIYAWHFSDGTLRYDRAGETITAGLVLETADDIGLCDYGFHASIKPLDALSYGHGAICSYVKLSGTIIKDTDKIVASHREHVVVFDATHTLHEFGIRVAAQSLLRERNAGREPDPRSWNALKVKRRWLTGKASDDDLAAAWAASRTAARAASSDAAWAASWAASWAAASDASRTAARTAASDAAWAAARTASWAAMNVRLTKMLERTMQQQEAADG